MTIVEAIDPGGYDEDDLVECAAADADEYVTKFTEACLRKDDLCPSSVYFVDVDYLLRMLRGH
jgi:hypothetical protein